MCMVYVLCYFKWLIPPSRAVTLHIQRPDRLANIKMNDFTCLGLQFSLSSHKMPLRVKKVSSSYLVSDTLTNVHVKTCFFSRLKE